MFDYKNAALADRVRFVIAHCGLITERTLQEIAGHNDDTILQLITAVDLMKMPSVVHDKKIGYYVYRNMRNGFDAGADRYSVWSETAANGLFISSNPEKHLWMTADELQALTKKVRSNPKIRFAPKFIYCRNGDPKDVVAVFYGKKRLTPSQEELDMVGSAFGATEAQFYVFD